MTDSEKLWAPWRIKYLHKGIKDQSCVFCRALKENRDNKNFIVQRNRHSFSILNIFPYNNGHVMVAPNRHVKDISMLKEEEILDLMRSLSDIKSRLDKTLAPHGYNIGINMGKTAGAGFPGHIHLHIVPRWNGDTNFMPVLSSTKVISQSLRELYKTLLRANREKQ